LLFVAAGDDLDEDGVDGGLELVVFEDAALGAVGENEEGEGDEGAGALGGIGWERVRCAWS
jgi:hypothetical protein